LSEFVKQIKPHFEKVTLPIINILSKINVSPNMLTLSGLLITAASSYFIYTKSFFTGAVLLTIGSLFDALDGHLARKSMQTSKFGAFLDSVVDRISDFLPLFALLFAFYENKVIVFSLLLTILFTFLVSYTRARAEGLGVQCNVGFFERPERLIILIVSLLLNEVETGILILLSGSFLTFIQRIYHVYKVSNTGT
jgi:CDP-diacylglycerol--glycerol-3-phosphate 3-phosphatidyltransferase